MIKHTILSLMLIALIAISGQLKAQTNDYQGRKCYQYDKDSCSRSSNIYYRYHNESRSALFLKGQTSRTPFEIYNGRDYRISLCWDPSLGNQIEFKILDRESEAVLYDNSTDEFSSEFEFTVAQSREIVIEVTVPGSSGGDIAQGDSDIVFVRKDKEMGCVGVLVEHMITPTKGF